eukprot:364804-Chlamydomonas_euryale.AAC.14
MPMTSWPGMKGNRDAPQSSICARHTTAAKAQCVMDCARACMYTHAQAQVHMHELVAGGTRCCRPSVCGAQLQRNGSSKGVRTENARMHVCVPAFLCLCVLYAHAYLNKG